MFPSKPLRVAKHTSIVCGAALALTACTTSEPTRSGFLSDYSLLEVRTDTVRAKIADYRNEELLDTITAVYIEPVEIGGNIGTRFSEEERAMIRTEVDRQICYEVSKRFDIAQENDPSAGRLRVAATRVTPTNAVGSVASTAANFFIPGPIGVRVPGSTGGLAAEAELLAPNGQQAAAVIWARDAQVVGTDNPSLSRVGDAHRLTTAFGQLVATAISPEDSKSRPVPTPDPCLRFGPRHRAEGIISRIVTGIYTPELSGSSPPTTPPVPDQD